MTTRDVNYLNIGLMLLAAVVAWEKPVELFFFAYGVLGPLHYLTEISWLHERKWFSTSRRDWIWPLAVALIMTGFYVASKVFGVSVPQIGVPSDRGGEGFYLNLADFLIWTAIGATVAGAFLTGAARKTACAVGISLIGVLLAQAFAVRMFTSIFLATLVHVFVFTACFILYGALKTRSVSGYVSLLCHAGFGAFLLFAPDGARMVNVSVEQAGQLEAFVPVLTGTSMLLGRPLQGPESQEGLKNALRFMSYAYTYHYLNWFSKTGFIRWHEMPKRRAMLVVVTWVVSAALYHYDWKTGFTALLALSLAHVFLEFPLNWRTFVLIGAELKARITGAGGAKTGETSQSPAAVR